jgi:hypothetical protein
MSQFIQDNVEVPTITVEIASRKKNSITTQSVTGIANEDTIYNYLTNTLGIKCAGACGVLGNMYVESSFNPVAYNSVEDAWGICQWENDRLALLQSRYPNSWKTLSSQLSFLKDELNGADFAGPKTLTYVKGVSDSTDGAKSAALYFAKNFERCAESTYSSRQTWAGKIHDKRHNSLSAPQNVKAVSVDGNKIKLTWDKVSNAYQYFVEIYDGTGKQINKVWTGYTDWTFSNLSLGTYKVYICSTTKDGKYSAKKEISVNVTVPTPQNVKAESVDGNKIKITWDKVESAYQYFVEIYDGTGKQINRVWTRYTDWTFSNLSLGTYKVYICSTTKDGKYSAKKEITINVTKPDQSISVTPTSKTVKASKVKKTAQMFTIKATAKGNVTFKKSSGSKNVTISKTGTVTVKKGTKNGTYKIKVKVSAAATSKYEATSKTVTITVKVK